MHLCVDVQRLFTTEGPWPTPCLPEILPAITALVQAHAPRTLFTRFVPPRHPEEMPGTWRRYYQRWREVTRDELPGELLDLVPPLAKYVPPARLCDKRVYSPFIGSSLAETLLSHGVDTLVITGIETDVCVLATALGAIDLGFRVVVVTDAVCSSSPTGHAALISVYRERYSEQLEAMTCADVLAAWRA